MHTLYLLIVNYYATDLIQKLINSLPSIKEVNYQILIVNNSPDDSSLNNINHPQLQIINAPKNLGFGQGCNLGLNWIYEHNHQALVWLLNPDTYLLPNILEKVANFIKKYPKLSIIGTIIYTPEHQIWFAGGKFNHQIGEIEVINLLDNCQDDYLLCDWVSGCSIILNLSNFTTCPQFDDQYFLYYEDFDFCQRYAQQGHQIVITNQLAVIHQPSTITNKNLVAKYQHSTYSYLLTLAKYTNDKILILRLLRLLIKSVLMLAYQPKASYGKILGIITFMNQNRSKP